MTQEFRDFVRTLMIFVLGIIVFLQAIQIQEIVKTQDQTINLVGSVVDYLKLLEK